MTVPVSTALAAAVAEARQQLLQSAAELAADAKRALTLAVSIPGGSTADRNAYYQHVLAEAEQSLKSGKDYWDESGTDRGTQILLSDSEYVGDTSGPTGPMRVNLIHSTGNSEEQLADLQATLAAPLDKKLGNQLTRAKGLGFPTLLILDQKGHEGLPMGVSWLPSSEAVKTVVAQCAGKAPGVLDAAVLAQADDSLVPVFGSVP